MSKGKETPEKSCIAAKLKVMHRYHWAALLTPNQLLQSNMCKTCEQAAPCLQESPLWMDEFGLFQASWPCRATADYTISGKAYNGKCAMVQMARSPTTQVCSSSGY